MIRQAILAVSGAVVFGALSPTAAQVQFVEVGAARGVLPYTTAYGKGGGVALADFDDDGDIDLFVPNGRALSGPDTADQLYRNDGGVFTEIAAAAGVASTANNRAALWFDYDGDRRLDLFVAGDCFQREAGCEAVGTLTLYRQVADGVFADVTVAAGLGTDLIDTAASHRGGAAAGDIDGDGWLDLVVGSWSAPRPRIFINNRDGTFTDAAVALGLVADSFYWQPLLHDFDRDTRLDVYYAIDFQDNFLWVHDGAGAFVDMAFASGANNSWNDMGIAPGDYDNDGRLDFYVTNITSGSLHNALFHNETVDGVLAFTEVAEAAGCAQGFWGWGCVFFDADNDTRLDLAATNGWFSGSWTADPSVFYYNQGGDPVTFTDMSDAVGFNDQLWGSSIVTADLDRDGDLDLVQTCNGSGATPPALRILDNVPTAPPESGPPNNWLVVKPRMSGPNHRAIGAVVRAQVGSTQMMRLIAAGQSFCGQEPAEAFFGLGPAGTVDTVTVEWPDGSVSTYDDVDANQTLTVGQMSFEDVSATAGIGLPGVLTESLAWGDYDGDGDEDLYLTNQNVPNNLFRNEGNDVFIDVAAVAGVDSALWGVGTGFADLDNDGDLDLYCVNFASGADHLYRNDGPIGPDGETIFTDVAGIAGIIHDRSSRGMAYIDFDRDGLLDIYVNAIGDDLLYHNLGGLQFADMAGAAFITTNFPDGQGVGVVCSDLDNDGWVDMYNGNRSGQVSNVFMNNGDDTFTDVAAAGGVTAFGLGMGVHTFDCDNDLDMDLYWTTWPAGGKTPVLNALYRNLGGNAYGDVAVATGTEDAPGWGISNNIGDIDNDRWMDFFVTNGFDEGSGPNVLFRNMGGAEGGVMFEDVTNMLGLPDAPVNYDGRGVAFADYDGDGDVDLCLTGDTDDENRLWRNDTVNGNHWVTFKLEGFGIQSLFVGSNRSAIGARIEVTAGGVTTINEVSSGAGRGSFNSLPVEFGLGLADGIDSLLVRWPSGRRQLITSGVAIDACVALAEPHPADIDADGDVDVDDLVAVIIAWATDGLGNPAIHPDTNNDGVVDVNDLNAVFVGWNG